MKSHDFRKGRLRALCGGAIAAVLVFVVSLLATAGAMASAPAARPGDRTSEPALSALAAVGPALSTSGWSVAGLGDGDGCTVFLPLGPSGAPVPVVLFPTVLEADQALVGVTPAVRLGEAFSDPGCRFLEGSFDLFE